MTHEIFRSTYTFWSTCSLAEGCRIVVAMRKDYSDLELAPDRGAGLYTIDQDHDKHIVSPTSHPPEYKVGTGDRWRGIAEPTSKTEIELAASGPEKRRICGLPWYGRWRYGITAAGLLIILAAIGGGVGGALSSRSDQSKTSQGSTNSVSSPENSSVSSSAQRSSMSDLASTTSTLAITTSTLSVGPTQTFLSDCPSSNNTIYSIQNGDSKPALFRKFCGRTLNGPPNGPISVNVRVQDLDECIDLCAAFNTQNQALIAGNNISPCNAVCFRNGRPPGNDYPYQCFGGFTANISNQFDLNTDGKTDCDSATWINQ